MLSGLWQYALNSWLFRGLHVMLMFKKKVQWIWIVLVVGPVPRQQWTLKDYWFYFHSFFFVLILFWHIFTIFHKRLVTRYLVNVSMCFCRDWHRRNKFRLHICQNLPVNDTLFSQFFLQNNIQFPFPFAFSFCFESMK